METTTYFPTTESVRKASDKLKDVISETPLQLNINVSRTHECNVYLKREDLQMVRSYKIRGAYNKVSCLTNEQLSNGVVCASAGNHAQGVAYSCNKLKVKSTVVMPVTTPEQKIEQVRMFGGDFVSLQLVGDTFDDAKQFALDYANSTKATFIHPFDDEKIIEGQATVGLEILEQSQDFKIDYLFVPIGGGGLAAGLGSLIHQLSPETKIIGVEPKGAPSMCMALKKGSAVELDSVDTFVDGASVRKAGDLTYEICKFVLNDIILVDEGKICETMLRLYSKDAIVVEPAGALTLSALDLYHEDLRGKNVVCVVSGGNNDITRTEEIRERAMIYRGLKHYFMVRFPQRAGALKQFVGEVLGPNDDIVHFEYTRKNYRETGSALVGLELSDRKDFDPLILRMKDKGFFGEYLNNKPDLFQYLV